MTKTRALGEKTTKKVELARQIVAGWWRGADTTYRQLAAVISLTTYAAEVLTVNLTSLRKSIGAFCRFMTETAQFARAEEWDKTILAARLASIDCEALENVLYECNANRPVPAAEVEDPEREVITIITDASAWGWSSMAFLPGGVEYHWEEWRAEDHTTHRLASSVHAEPLAMVRAACRHLPGHTTAVVRFVSDHAGMIWAFEKPTHAVKCVAYYETRTKLYELFPFAKFVGAFVEGAKNPVDGGSRGRAADIPRDESLLQSLDIRRLMRQKGARKPWML